MESAIRSRLGSLGQHINVDKICEVVSVLRIAHSWISTSSKNVQFKKQMRTICAHGYSIAARKIKSMTETRRSWTTNLTPMVLKIRPTRSSSPQPFFTSFARSSYWKVVFKIGLVEMWWALTKCALHGFPNASLALIDMRKNSALVPSHQIGEIPI